MYLIQDVNMNEKSYDIEFRVKCQNKHKYNILSFKYALSDIIKIIYYIKRGIL
jgi:hypothetical protein